MAKTAEKSAVREFRAEARFQRTSPQKAKLVLDTIKGLSVENALNTLMFTRKRIAPVVEKALRSAIQNAAYLSQEQGFDLDVDRLVVKQAVANEGPRMKRIRPAPMGRAFRYQRRLAHIIVTVAERKSVENTGASTAAATTAAGKKKSAPAKKAAARKSAKVSA
jgi:large subunit ribosomal protein L22